MTGGSIDACVELTSDFKRSSSEGRRQKEVDRGSLQGRLLRWEDYIIVLNVGSEGASAGPCTCMLPVS